VHKIVFFACRARSHTLTVTGAMAREGVPLIGGMAGHPAICRTLSNEVTLYSPFKLHTVQEDLLHEEN